MRQDFKANISQCSVERATDYAKYISEDYVAKSLQFLSDGNKADRIRRGLCKTCFYFRLSRVGGAAMTSRPCGICGEEQHYGSTATDPLCLACANEWKLCKQCGGDSLMRIRRKDAYPGTKGRLEE